MSSAAKPLDWKEHIDSDLVRDLSRAVIETPSPTGHEGDMARLLGTALDDLGLEVSYQTLYDDRLNVVARWRGNSPGPTVLFSGHLDTSVTGKEEWLTGSGWKNSAIFEDGWVYGNGIFNMKAAFVSYLAMVEAMRRTGVRLPGEIIVAGTVGEIELSPIDEFQGKEYDSYGVGTRFLLNHGVAADYHVLGEPSALTPLTGMMGTVWVKLTTHGDFVHTAFSGAHQDAIEATERLWHALQSWRESFVATHSMGSVRARVNRAAVRGGLPWRAARTAAQCSQYIDLRFHPECSPIEVQRELRCAVDEACAEASISTVDIEFYMSRPGTALPVSHPLITTLERSHEEVTGDRADVQFAPPVCTDAIDSNRLGIPTVVYGPAGRAQDGERDLSSDPRAAEGEGVPLEDMETAAAVYAQAALGLTSKPLAEVRRERLTMPGVYQSKDGVHAT